MPRDESTMTVTYKADSLEGLAMILDTRANEIKAMGDAHKTQHKQLSCYAEAYGLRSAARMVRQTVIECNGLVADKDGIRALDPMG